MIRMTIYVYNDKTRERKLELGASPFRMTPQFITHHITTLERFLRGKFRKTNPIQNPSKFTSLPKPCGDNYDGYMWQY